MKNFEYICDANKIQEKRSLYHTKDFKYFIITEIDEEEANNLIDIYNSDSKTIKNIIKRRKEIQNAKKILTSTDAKIISSLILTILLGIIIFYRLDNISVILIPIFALNFALLVVFLMDKYIV